MDAHAPTSAALSPQETLLAGGSVRPRLSLVLCALLASDGASFRRRQFMVWSSSFGADWERALAQCPDRRWLTQLAGDLLHRGHLKHEVLVTTACACARSVLHLVSAGEERPRLAIEAAEGWVRGDATYDDVREACDRAYACAYACADARAFDAATAAARAAAAAVAVGAAATDATDGVAVSVSAAGRAEVEPLEIMRRELVPALLEGLTAYAATLPGASR